jgi:hypothetical protein
MIIIKIFSFGHTTGGFTGLLGVVGVTSGFVVVKQCQSSFIFCVQSTGSNLTEK